MPFFGLKCESPSDGLITEIKSHSPKALPTLPLHHSAFIAPAPLFFLIFISFHTRLVSIETGGRLPPACLFGYNKNKSRKEREQKGREALRKGLERVKTCREVLRIHLAPAAMRFHLSGSFQLCHADVFSTSTSFWKCTPGLKTLCLTLYDVYNVGCASC